MVIHLYKSGDSFVQGTKNPRLSQAGDARCLTKNPFCKQNIRKEVSACTAKVSIFFGTNALSADFFIFHTKREAIAHGRQATEPVFPLWAPN